MNPRPSYSVATQVCGCSSLENLYLMFLVLTHNLAVYLAWPTPLTSVQHHSLMRVSKHLPRLFPFPSYSPLRFLVVLFRTLRASWFFTQSSSKFASSPCICGNFSYIAVMRVGYVYGLPCETCRYSSSCCSKALFCRRVASVQCTLLEL